VGIFAYPLRAMRIPSNTLYAFHLSRGPPLAREQDKTAGAEQRAQGRREAEHFPLLGDGATHHLPRSRLR
jgi:hypothetical protein